VFVVGGAAIYGMFIPFADSLFYTRIRWTFPEADSHFAVPDKSVWSVKHTRLYPPDENNQYPYQFANMERINPWSKMMI
jgi:dihydrofolate reductase